MNMKVCPVCGGWPYENCDLCDGRGKTTSGFDCYKCKGTGKIPCDRCEGEGYVPEDEN